MAALHYYMGIHGSRWKLEGPKAAFYAPASSPNELDNLHNDKRRPEGHVEAD